MKRLAALVLLPLAVGCASNTGEVRAPASENDFVTGSRIPGKGRGVTMSRDDLEHLRSTAQQPIPEHLKDKGP